MSTRRTPSEAEARNLAAFRRLIEAGFSRGDPAVVDEVAAPDCVVHQPGMGPGFDGLKGAIRFLHAAFPDFALSVEETSADGDLVWGRLRGRGTYLGPLGSFPATGRPFAIDVLDLCRFPTARSSSTGACPIGLRSWSSSFSCGAPRASTNADHPILSPGLTAPSAQGSERENSGWPPAMMALRHDGLSRPELPPASRPIPAH